VTVGDEPLARWMDYFRCLQGAEHGLATASGLRQKSLRSARGSRNALPGRRRWVSRISQRARARREEIARRMAEMLGGRAVLALPSAPGIALLRNSPPKVLDDLRARALPILCIAGLARLPKCHCRWRSSTVARSGLSLIAARGNDTLLLELAGRLMAEHA